MAIHPCCEDGMALQCGWSYNKSEMVDLEAHEQQSQHRRMDELYLDFLARRNRLQQVTGMTASQLLETELKLCGEQSADDLPRPRLLHRAPTMELSHD